MGISLKKNFFVIFLFFLIIYGHSLIRPDIGFAEKRFLIKFATVAPEGSTWMKHMRQLDKRLREKSNGQIGFRLYAGGIAGDEIDVLRKIRIGQIHCAAFSGVGIAQILPMVRVLDLPFLFRNEREIGVVQSELRDYFSKEFRKKRFEFLAWAEVGNVHLFSKKPVRKVSDLSKLRIWTWAGDPISKKTFSVMGTTPIPLSITDVTTALNTGMIDTVYGPPLGALALQWHSHIKYMTSLPLAHATGTLLIYRDYFNRIPRKLSKLLKDEYQLIMADLSSDLKKQSKEAVSLIKESGVNIIPMPSGTELDEFYSVHDIVAGELSGKIYPKDLLNQVYEILNRTR